MKFLTSVGSELRIPKIGMGTMGFGGNFHRDSADDAESIELLQAGIDLGMTLIDTAEAYGDGHTEELVGQAVAGRREEVLISSKFSPENSTYDRVIRAAEASLRRLGVERIDIYQPHWPNPRVPLAETIGAVAILIDQGKVRSLGLSNFDHRATSRVREFASIPVQSIQYEYNVADRSAERELIPGCAAEQCAFVGYSPLLQGRMVPDPQKRQQLAEIASSYSASVSQLVLAWLTREPQVATIPKTTSRSHLAENARAGDLSLHSADVDVLSEVFSSELIEVSPDSITVYEESERNVYRTLEEALENRFDYVPGPSDLADELQSHGMMKPVKVSAKQDGKQSYALLEGRLRYWAWVIAYGTEVPIPALIIRS